jgi:hypothetical protein
MSTFGYAVEQIGQAVHTLATTDGDLRTRLLRAEPDIVFAPPTDLPAELKERLELVRERASTIGEMQPNELSQYADQLVALAFCLHREAAKRS